MKDIYYPHAHKSQKEIDNIKNRYDTFDESLISELVKNAINKEVINYKKSS